MTKIPQDVKDTMNRLSFTREEEAQVEKAYKLVRFLNILGPFQKFFHVHLPAYLLGFLAAQFAVLNSGTVVIISLISLFLLVVLDGVLLFITAKHEQVFKELEFTISKKHRERVEVELDNLINIGVLKKKPAEA